MVRRGSGEAPRRRWSAGAGDFVVDESPARSSLREIVRAGSSIPSNGAGSVSDERGGSSNPSNRGGSTTAPSECSDDEESGELGDAFANDASAPHVVPAATTLVKPISRRPSASNLPLLADVGAAPQVTGRGRGAH